MNSEINKFKRKVNLEAILRSLLLGLAIGLISCGSPILYFKINKYTVNINPYIMGMVGVFVLVFLITYLITKPSEIKVAKRIDKELGLNEKATTMVVYKNETDPMYKVQREDTTNILSKISIKALSFKVSIFLIVLCLLGIGVFATALAYPTYVPPVVEEPKEETTDFQEAVIRQLIRDIKADPVLNAQVKMSYVAHLATLDENISVVMINSKREQFVKDCISDCKDVALEYAYIDDIAKVISKLEESDEYQPLDNFLVQIKDYLSYKLFDISGFLEELKVLQTSMTTSIESAKDGIKFYRMFVGTPLKNDETLDKENLIYKKFIKLSDDLSALSINSSNYKTEIDNVFDNIIQEFSTVMLPDNRIIYWAKEIETRLSIAFLGMVVSNPSGGSNETTVTPSEEDPTGDGQILNGGYSHPSEMEVYSSILGAYEKYYENLGEYDQKIRDQFEDGLISEELYNVFEKYFSSLIETQNGGN